MVTSFSSVHVGAATKEKGEQSSYVDVDPQLASVSLDKSALSRSTLFSFVGIKKVRIVDQIQNDTFQSLGKCHECFLWADRMTFCFEVACGAGLPGLMKPRQMTFRTMGGTQF